MHGAGVEPAADGKLRRETYKFIRYHAARAGGPTR